MFKKGDKVYYVSEPFLVYEAKVVGVDNNTSKWELKYVVEYTYPETRYLFSKNGAEKRSVEEVLKRVLVASNKLIGR